MHMTIPRRILVAEKMRDAIFVEFDDGKCALYSVSLLYTALPLAATFNLSDDLDAEVKAGDAGGVQEK